MITKTLKIGLIIMAVTSFSYSGAQESKEYKENRIIKKFKKFDANFDQAISLEEFKAVRLKDDAKAAQIEKRFAKMDADKNGTLDLTEFKNSMAQKKKAKMTKAVKPTKG